MTTICSNDRKKALAICSLCDEYGSAEKWEEIDRILIHLVDDNDVFIRMALLAYTHVIRDKLLYRDEFYNRTLDMAGTYRETVQRFK